MRAELGAIQQSLTPEASGVLNQSVAEAGRRNHGQTTPLHVAATLLASPSGFLRQACIRSHPNSSHPLQCRALELCFSVALERLATIPSMSEPPVSNALMAALKRAQANQRRGGAEPQQSPLLAVKVELDQLIISVLDDPSVSRVMREAGFSSPAVKATIEQSIAKSTPHQYNANAIPFLPNQYNSHTTTFLPNGLPAIPGIFPRLGNERLLGSPVEAMYPIKGFRQSRHVVPDTIDSGARTEVCPRCWENYEKEQAKLTAIEKTIREATRPSLPQWLQNAKMNDNHGSLRKDTDGGILSEQQTRELRKKWRDTCLHLHPNFHQKTLCDISVPPLLFMTTSSDSNLLTHSMFFPPKIPRTTPLGQLNTNQNMFQQAHMANIPPGSPVRTDLVLGRKEVESTIVTEDLSGCICSDILSKPCDNFSDADTYKKLLKDLMENAWWQVQAASGVASAITRWKLGNGKQQGTGSRGDIWLLFAGPDRVGKKKMASALGKHVCGGSPVMISLGTHWDDDEAKVNARFATVITQIVETVERKPFSVIMLEDVDETCGLVRRNIQHAIENGRVTDTHGREVSLGNAIFVLTGNWSRINPKGSGESCYIDEATIASKGRGNWTLRLVIQEKSTKRHASWVQEEDSLLVPRKEVRLSNVSLDLTLTPKDNDKTHGSDHNSSDLTIDHDHKLSPKSPCCSLTPVVPHDLINNVDEFIVFWPVDSGFALREIKKAISLAFSLAKMDDNWSIEVEDEVLEKILGGLWHDETSLREWIDNVVSPSFDKIKSRLQSKDGIVSVVQLIVMEQDSGQLGSGKSKLNGDLWLPSTILV